MDRSAAEVLVFYKIGEQHWVQIHAGDEQSSKVVDLDLTTSKEQEAPVIVDEGQIDTILRSSITPSGRYRLLYWKRTVAFQRVGGPFAVGIGRRTEEFVQNVRWIVERFRRVMWNRLVESLYSKASGVRDVLDRLRSHTFSDHYSLWLYNEHTRHFHLHCASFSSEREFVSKSDSSATLGETLDETEEYVFRAIARDKVNSSALSEMNSVNRFKIISGAGMRAVLSFYSRHPNFPFSDRIVGLIPEIIGAKLIREFSPYLEKHLQIKDLADDYAPGELDRFLQNLAPKLVSLLGWEAISVFLVNEERTQLILRALASTQVAGGEFPVVSYDLRSSGLTVSAFNQSELKFSYEINSESSNSHHFDEPTDSSARNWIGIPIYRAGELPVGVLRAKNRNDGQGVKAFNALDVDLLQDVCSEFAYLSHLEAAFNSRQHEIQEDLAKQEEENKQLNEFIKTFRHELKSPLTVVTQASNIIKKALSQSGAMTEEQLPKKVRDVLSDLDMVGNRLVFVTSVLTFDAHDLVKDIEPCKLFQDIVSPVLAFSMSYARNRRKNIKVDKDSLILDVRCDSKAASMVFHMLLDNAIKYSSTEASITVRGQADADYCSIVVENYGLAILPEEKDDVFLRYFRGKHAERQKTEGSGIGLYLAREIMKLNRGIVILKRPSAPTVFELRIERMRRK